MKSKNGFRNLITRADLQKLDRATSNGNKRLTIEIGHLNKKVGSLDEKFNGLNKKINRVEVSLRQAIIDTARNTKEEIKEELREEFKEMRMDILGAVSDFAKRTTDVELAQNLLSARVEDHEDRLVKIGGKISPHA